MAGELTCWHQTCAYALACMPCFEIVGNTQTASCESNVPTLYSKSDCHCQVCLLHHCCYKHQDCYEGFFCILQGDCSSPLPVGLPGYIASEHAQLKSSSQTPAHTRTPVELHIPTLSHPQSPSQGLPGSAEGPAGIAGQQRDAAQASRGRQVGVHANAAWDPNPELAGCGPLLPSWRQLADLFMPLLHRVSS